MKLRSIVALALALVSGPALAQVNPGTAPLSIAKGGTAAATAPAAWINLVQPPGASALGGIKSLTCSASNWFNTLSTAGALGCAQPNFTDLAGTLGLAQIPASLITYAKIQNVTAARLLGNPTGGAAAPSEISLGAAFTFSGTALQTVAHTGDVTTPANSFATTIAANAVTNAKMATMAANTVKANATGGAAVPTDVTPATARSASLLNVDQFTGHGDSIYTILATDRTVGTNAAFTASRTWTLPAANAVNPGQELVVADYQGTVTGVNTLIVARAGADTINGGTTATISAANGGLLFRSDGVSKWTAQAFTAGSGITSLTCGAGLSGGTITTSGTCAILNYTSAGSWTPADNSGAALAFTGISAGWSQIGNMVFAYANLTYPSTAGGASASLSGFPVAFAAAAYGRQCTVTVASTGLTVPIALHPNASASTAAFKNQATGAALTNANMSLATVYFMCIYPAT